MIRRLWRHRVSPDSRSGLSPEMLPVTFGLVASVNRRLQVVAGLHALAAGLAFASALVVTAAALRLPMTVAWTVALVSGVALTAGAFVRARRQLTDKNIAIEIEHVPALENLLVTAVELTEPSRTAHPLVVGELARQIEERTRQVSPASVISIRRAAALAIVVAIGAALVSWSVARASGRAADTPIVGAEGDAAPASAERGALKIIVTPPAYSGRPSTTMQDVAQIEVLEGSRVRLEMSPAAGSIHLIEAGQPPIALEADAQGRSTELVADRTRFLLLRSDGPSEPRERLLAVLVTPDAAPIVRIRQPARDLRFSEPRGHVAVEVDATDDLALGSLSLHYTRASGSGENLTFEEGDLPLRVQRVGANRWEARTDLSLEALKLQDGDTFVYRAMTTDLRPGRDPSASEAFLLEVGKLAQVTSAGFALPEDKDRQALSQQMLIVKTERLHAERDRLPREEFANRSRLLAIEQRMVRAEFIFMTGGEVQDEVAEAEHSHDLAEGRFENAGQVELLTAIREMSRAEARLNDAETAPALTFERSALKALQRAFDRRRYLLRTMPERARIDQTRRMSGELKDARSWRRPPLPSAERKSLQPLEALARDLAAARRDGNENVASLAARLGAVDPNAADVQKAALALSASSGAPAAERAVVIDDALRLVAERARQALASTRGWLSHDPAAGRYADALSRKGAKP